MSISQAFPLGSKASGVALEYNFKNNKPNNGLFPQRVVVIGPPSEGAAQTDGQLQTNDPNLVGQQFGYGSLLHLAALNLFPSQGGGIGFVPTTFVPTPDSQGMDGSDYRIEALTAPTSSGTYRVSVNNILSVPFSVDDTDTEATTVLKMIAAINATPNLPVTADSPSANVCNLSAKWGGASGQFIAGLVVGPDTGLTFSYSQSEAGTGTPDVNLALAQITDEWDTVVINLLEWDAATELDKYRDFNLGRWSPVTHKPFICFSGANETTWSNVTDVTDLRKSDYTNIILNSAGSPELPQLVAVNAAAVYVNGVLSDPAFDFIDRIIPNITPGNPADQPKWEDREIYLQKGTATAYRKGENVLIGDLITCLHPDGVDDPGLRYVVDFSKLGAFNYVLDAKLSEPQWSGAPLVPDSQPYVTNRNAKQPKDLKTLVISIVEDFAERAILSDPKAIIATIIVDISDDFPKRLEMYVRILLSGNTNQKAGTVDYSFYYGSGGAA